MHKKAKILCLSIVGEAARNFTWFPLLAPRQKLQIRLLLTAQFDAFTSNRELGTIPAVLLGYSYGRKLPRQDI